MGKVRVVLSFWFTIEPQLVSSMSLIFSWFWGLLSYKIVLIKNACNMLTIVEWVILGFIESFRNDSALKCIHFGSKTSSLPARLFIMIEFILLRNLSATYWRPHMYRINCIVNYFYIHCISAISTVHDYINCYSFTYYFEYFGFIIRSMVGHSYHVNFYIIKLIWNFIY